MATATANGFSKTSGFVEQVKRGENRVAIKLGEHWFSKFGSLEVNEGDEVKLAYKVVEKGDRTYRNLESVEPVNPKPAPKPNPTTSTGHTPSDKDDAIARAVALKTAAAWVDAGARVADVLYTANVFLAWLQGEPVAQDDEQDDVPF